MSASTRHNLAAAICFALALPFGVWFFVGPSEGGTSQAASDAAETQGRGAAEPGETSLDGEAGDFPSAQGAGGGFGRRPQRATLEVDWQPSDLVEDSSMPLRGVVLDPLGQPVRGAQVVFRDPSGGARLRSALDGGVQLISVETTTDERGRFEISVVSNESEGLLCFGQDLLCGQAPTQAVVRGAEEQRLLLPSRPQDTPRVRVDVVDRATGAVLELHEVQARLQRLPTLPELDPSGSGQPLPRRALKRPRSDQVLRGFGWAELELWPGTWELLLTAENTATRRLAVEVPYSGDPIEIRIELDVYDPAEGWQSVEVGKDGGLEPKPEVGEGFDQHLIEDFPNRQLGEQRADLAFRHTLRFSPGTYSEAHLELDLESASKMAYNDGLGLEFEPEGTPFVFFNRLSSLTGDAWHPPTRRRLLLDLAALSRKGKTYNLLDELSDGMLDVYIQDDTAVHGLRLFLKR